VLRRPVAVAVAVDMVRALLRWRADRERASIHMPKTNKDVRDTAITVGSAALAAPALSLPLVWVAACLGMRLVAGSLRRAQEAGEPGPSVAGVVSTLSDGLRRVLPRAIPVLARGAFTLATAFVVVAVLVGGPWVASNGTAGWLVAVRLAAYEHLLPLFCALVCWRILRGRSGTGSAVGPLFDAYLKPPTQTRLLVAGAPCLLALVLFVFVMPRAPWAPWGSFEGAVGSLPAATRDAVFGLRRDLVDAEVGAVLTCVELEQGDLGWESRVAAGPTSGALRVRIVRSSRAPSTRADVSGLVLALHHQLPRVVTELTVQRQPNFSALRIDRTKVSQTSPQDNTDALAAAAGVEPRVLPFDDAVRRVGLRCGAKAL
jgi:hypothetical protein